MKSEKAKVLVSSLILAAILTAIIGLWNLVWNYIWGVTVFNLDFILGVVFIGSFIGLLFLGTIKFMKLVE